MYIHIRMRMYTHLYTHEKIKVIEMTDEGFIDATTGCM